jgi:hypothetical protein
MRGGRLLERGRRGFFGRCLGLRIRRGRRGVGGLWVRRRGLLRDMEGTGRRMKWKKGRGRGTRE